MYDFEIKKLFNRLWDDVEIAVQKEGEQKRDNDLRIKIGMKIILSDQVNPILIKKQLGLRTGIVDEIISDLVKAKILKKTKKGYSQREYLNMIGNIENKVEVNSLEEMIFELTESEKKVAMEHCGDLFDLCFEKGKSKKYDDLSKGKLIKRSDLWYVIGAVSFVKYDLGLLSKKK